jgi:serine protease
MSSFRHRLFIAWTVLAAMLTTTSAVPAARTLAAPHEQQGISSLPQELPTDQLIVRFRVLESASDTPAPSAPSTLMAMSQAGGADLAYYRDMSGDAHVLKLRSPMSPATVENIAARLEMLPEVEYAVPDRIMLPLGKPNDPRYDDQWHYSGTNGINLEAAWDVTTGSAGIVVAVVDTGILPGHPDLAGRLLPGYDFISDAVRARDGNGRDTNPVDEGDWAVAGDCFPNSPAEDSSWHGTHVAGTIGAATNNGIGVAGVDWHARILPVRALGRCGGHSSDIIDAIRWSAGLHKDGVPDNTTPADVINLSLGAEGACGTAYQDAINEARGRGAVVVVAAGNDNVDASNAAPANCAGVITVAATNDQGNRAGFSNFGNLIEISAPGTDVVSTTNNGTMTPGADTYLGYDGTSMATPHVAGVVSLLLSVRPELTPDQVLQQLQHTVTAFPNGSSCNTANCGAGTVNAYEAVSSLYVAKGADGIGLPLQPYGTFQDAYNRAWPGARIKLRAERYTAPLTLDKRVALVALDGPVTLGR